MCIGCELHRPSDCNMKHGEQLCAVLLCLIFSDGICRRPRRSTSVQTTCKANIAHGSRLRRRTSLSIRLWNQLGGRHCVPSLWDISPHVGMWRRCSLRLLYLRHSVQRYAHRPMLTLQYYQGTIHASLSCPSGRPPSLYQAGG